MDPKELDAIAALLAKATPGPFGLYGNVDDIAKGRHALSGQCVGSVEHTEPVACFFSYLLPQYVDNAKAFVALRNHAPSLLAAARRLAEAEALLKCVADAPDDELLDEDLVTAISAFLGAEPTR